MLWRAPAPLPAQSASYALMSAAIAHSLGCPAALRRGRPGGYCGNFRRRASQNVSHPVSGSPARLLVRAGEHDISSIEFIGDPVGLTNLLGATAEKASNAITKFSTLSCEVNPR